MKKTNDTQTERKELKELFALWLNKSKNGDEYLSGYTSEEKPSERMNLVAFYNNDKKNPNEPDIRVYEKGDKLTNEVASLWVNTSKNNIEYLSGTDNEGKKLVGFYGDKSQEKRPYIRVCIEV